MDMNNIPLHWHEELVKFHYVSRNMHSMKENMLLKNQQQQLCCFLNTLLIYFCLKRFSFVQNFACSTIRMFVYMI